MSYAVKEIFYTLQGEGAQAGRVGPPPSAALRHEHPVEVRRRGNGVVRHEGEPVR